MSLPVIAHADVNYNAWGRVEITMHEGWVYYDTYDYRDLVDEEGNPRPPHIEELQCYRYGVFSPSTDFANRIVVIAESEVPPYQIFSTGSNPEIM